MDNYNNIYYDSGMADTTPSYSITNTNTSESAEVISDTKPYVVMGGYYDTYYGCASGEVPTVIPGDNPGGDYATDAEVKEAINNALNSINIIQTDDDSFALQVGERITDPIDDVYVTGVERDDTGEEKVVKFLRSNGRQSLNVNLSEFEDPNIDGSTF